MNYKKIVVAGGGVLGSQIAFQSAYCGYDVTIWLRSEDSKTRTQPKLDTLKKDYIETIESLNPHDENSWARGISDIDSFNKEECLKKVDLAYNNIKLEVDMKEAVKDADLVIESMAEIKDEKIKFYQTLAPLLEEKTVIVTNSSTLLPSMFAKYTGRPEKYLSLHFANTIWIKNTAEVMAHEETNKKYFDEIMDFAVSIRMLPLPVLKEKSGYLLNSMLVPFLLRTTAKNIVEQYQKVPGLMSPLLKKMMLPYNYKGMLNMLNKYIDEGKLGKSTGEGFYKYDKS